MLRSLFARRPVKTVPRPVDVGSLDLRADTVPTLSDTVVRAIALATDPNAALADFAALARRDAAVTAVLLKRSASAAFGGAANDVGQAVVWLGLATCTQLVAAVGLRDILRDYPPDVRERCEIVLCHSLFVANIAAQLNHRLGLGFRGEEYTGGLLHDIGRVVLSARFPTSASVADPLDFDESAELIVREWAAFGTDHCGVGQLFAVQNGLPEAVGRVLFRHHDPENEWGHRRLVALVATSDGLANHLQRFRTLRGYDPNACRGYAVRAEQWEGRHHGHYRTNLPEALRAALRETRGTLRSFAA